MTTKDIIIIIIIIIIKNMQNKLHTIHFFSLSNHRLHSQSPSSDHGTHGLPEVPEFHWTHEFWQTPWPLGKRLNSQKILNSLKKRVKISWKRVPFPDQLSLTSVVWKISTGQPGLSAWLCSLSAPPHLLVSETWETEKRFLIS